MKKLASICLIIFALAGCQKKGPRDVVLDRDVCAKCAMQLSDPRFVAQAVHKETGAQVIFEEPGCAVSWLYENGKDSYILYVTDLKSHKWLKAEDAAFTGGYITPMSYGIAALADAKDLEDGKTLISYDEAVKHIISVYEERANKK